VENEMRSLKKLVVTVGLLSVLLAGSLRAQSGPVLRLDAEAFPWKRLAYTAKKVFGTVTTEIQWENLAVEKVRKLLIPAPRGEALQTADHRVFSIKSHAVVKSLWAADDVLKTQAWYDPGNGAVLQRVRWRHGQERWQKTYRFTDKGVFRVRKTPGSPEKNDDTPVQWSNIKESFYPYTLNSAGCPHVLEPLVLLFIVSAIDFESDSVPLSFCVFNKKQLHQVQIRKAGVQRLKIDYLEKVAETEVRRKRKIEAVKFSINTRSLAGKEKKTEPFSFLGLKGDFDIYLDKTAKIPVQVCGYIPGFGEVKIRLQKIEFSK
jgi:hypothetical protein